MKCVTCKQGKMERQSVGVPTQVGSHVVTDRSASVMTCNKCGEYLLSYEDAKRCSLRAVIVVLAEKPLTGPIFKSARKALGLKQTELGELLGYASETISRFENDKEPIPPATKLAMQRLVELVSQHGEGALDSEWRPPIDSSLSVGAA